jgi:hypothetical protein
MRRVAIIGLVVFFGISVAALSTPLPARGGAAGTVVPADYRLRKMVTGLDFPTAITFHRNHLWVSEAGFLPGLLPKVKAIQSGGTTTVLSARQLPNGTLLGPLTDVTFHRGWLWITHRQIGVHGWYVGAISKFRPNDPVHSFQTVITNLPAAGDHYPEEIDFQGGRAYLSQGSATNSSVVGPDNQFVTGWLKLFPTFRDFPPVDVILSGAEYRTTNPLTSYPDDTAVTAPYMPFDSGPVARGTVVHGASPDHPQDGIIAGTGTLYSFDPRASHAEQTLRLEAWGFRNPYGFVTDPLNPHRILVTNNGADIRSVTRHGSVEVVEPRPVAEEYDDLYAVRIGGPKEFFGWPDYFVSEETGKVLPITNDLFCESPLLPPSCEHRFTFAASFRKTLDVKPAVAEFDNHSSANKLDASMSSRFGHRGDLFVAETGAFVPVTGAEHFEGYRIVRVDRDTHAVKDFIVNAGNTADELFDPSQLNKPIDVKFDRSSMLVVDFGAFEPGLGIVEPGTGKVWIVRHK